MNTRPSPQPSQPKSDVSDFGHLKVPNSGKPELRCEERGEGADRDRRHVFASKDFLAGNLYMAFGLLGLWLARALETGSANAMEAGYFPRLVCGLLIIVGAALAATSVVRGGQSLEGGQGLERGKWRPFVFVTMSCLAFALLLHPFGLVLTLAISTMLARLASGDIRAIPLLLLCLILIVANVGIFVLALRVVIPLWPAAF